MLDDQPSTDAENDELLGLMVPYTEIPDPEGPMSGRRPSTSSGAYPGAQESVNLS